MIRRMDEHRELQIAALDAEGRGAQALLDDHDADAREAYEEAATLYRRSYEAAPPDAYGRLVGLIKAAIIADSGVEDEAAYVRERADGSGAVGAYAVALAALAQGDEAAAGTAAGVMRADGGEPFARAADAIAALARGDRDAYGEAVRAIVADFEGREHHVAKVPIADTALVLERLAERRGLAARPDSALLP
jgi:hypothetical protein